VTRSGQGGESAQFSDVSRQGNPGIGWSKDWHVATIAARWRKRCEPRFHMLVMASTLLLSVCLKYARRPGWRQRFFGG
jgi:hypothetical protein